VLDKKVREAEEYQQHLEQEQSDGQVATFFFFFFFITLESRVEGYKSL